MSGKGIIDSKNSWNLKSPLDKDFRSTLALPWFTFSSLNFLVHILDSDWKVFEYGCGYSSFFWSSRVKEYHGVEDDENWYNVTSTKINKDANIELVKKNDNFKINLLMTLDKKYPNKNNLSDEKMNEKHGISNLNFQEYANHISKFPEKYFDVIVIDGKARKFSTFSALNKIKDSGIFILDNSDRVQYKPIFEFLFDNGWFKIDFWGDGPLNSYKWCTSFFIKDLNALRLKNNLLPDYECVFKF